ncbi:MAG: VOC family protein [Actinomycetota bacterium]
MSSGSHNAASAVVGYIIIDGADAELLAKFWSQLLNVEIGSRRGPYVFLQRLPSSGLGFGLQRVAEPKAGKNRVHVDLIVPDVGAAARRVEALGGRRVPGYEPGGFLVMADPEGNEFCVLPSEFEMDEHGNVDYLSRIEL